ncbi:DUF2799 domain-containing protein [Microvirga tunisiensis]|uniref:DUF2799 domain-containing protein n=3 Tax=Pannonibacter tanglangensis TaxID=2750084 RepID=A0ABW9ZRM6_9HYPH|nr:DUF2799 domain-containing protein [Pannonibacter sp. XCT-34]NBN80164.1 DUF2799 domain-containing protein [Pannonibacter sp. XCT-53]
MAMAGGALLALALAGCETVSKEQCQAGDWVALGRADGSVGHPAARIENIMKDCGRHGITPDPQAYYAGWQEGVQIYCTPMNGYNLGRNGTTKSNICPPALVGPFDYAYQLGFRLWSARNEVQQLEGRVRSLESQIDRDRFTLNTTDCNGVRPEDRDNCRNTRERTRDRIEDARFEIQDLRWRIMQKQQELQATEIAVNAEAARVIPGYGR